VRRTVWHATQQESVGLLAAVGTHCTCEVNCGGVRCTSCPAHSMLVEEQRAGVHGFIGAGRWLLPVFKKNGGLEYDIVTYPTNTGKKIESEPIPTAYAVINAKSPNPDAAFAFLTDFVSKEGQTFRLQGGGNAVPSVCGADNVVSEDNLPQNWQALIDAREIGC
jgi:ABC-type glycerol-3-phosphate transport system substrate-binding protein